MPSEALVMYVSGVFVTASRRNLANTWTYRFVVALSALGAGPEPQLALDVVQPLDGALRDAAIAERVRPTALPELPQPFAFADLVA